MIIWSRWDPSAGLYDYFETEDRPGINDDLPVPRLPAATELGVPSTEAGRALPSGAVHIGSGEFLVGLAATPAGVDKLSAVPSLSELDGWSLVIGAVSGVFVGWVLWRCA